MRQEQIKAVADGPELVPVPPHVPEELVADFDFYNPPGADRDFHRAWRALQDSTEASFIWTPRNGGHWIPLRGEDIHVIMADYEHFASGLVILPEWRGRDQKVLPTSLNPPEHGRYRALLNPGLSPKAIQALEPVIRETAAGCIEGFQAAGACEFIADYASVLPLRVFMNLVDLPFQDIPRLKYLADQITRPDGSMTMAELMTAFHDYLDPYLAQRRQSPGADMLSQIANGLVNGETVAYPAAMDLCVQLLIGGMDTVASFLGFMLLFLANNLGHRRQLLDNPALIPAAVDEFLRRFPLVSITRTVAKDHHFSGVNLKAGDYISVPTMLHGLDPTVYDAPLEVDFHREIGAHTTFGNGPHRCPGSFLARTELRVTLEEWLRRIPDFHVSSGKRVEMSGGIVGSVRALPLEWDVSGATK